MKKFAFVFSLISFYSIAIAQPSSEINKSVQNGYAVILGKDRPESGIPPKGKFAEGNMKNGYREGEWIFYHQDGKTIKTIGTFVRSKPTGAYKKFHDNGKLKECGSFVNNLNVDSLKRYYKNGTLEYEAFFNTLGREEGPVKYYHRNGTLELSYTVTAGEISEIRRFNEEGTLVEKTNDTVDIHKLHITELYLEKRTAPVNKEPLSDGYHLTYDKNGNKDQEGEFTNNQLVNGQRFLYNEDGIPTEIEVYVNGYLHSYAQVK